MYCVCVFAKVTLMHARACERVHAFPLDPTPPQHNKMCSHSQSNYIKSSHITHLFAIFQSFSPRPPSHTQYAVLPRKTEIRNCVVVAYFASPRFWYVMMCVRTSRCLSKNVVLFRLKWINYGTFCLLWLYGCDCVWIQYHWVCWTDKCCRSQKTWCHNSLAYNNITNICIDNEIQNDFFFSVRRFCCSSFRVDVKFICFCVPIEPNHWFLQPLYCTRYMWMHVKQTLYTKGSKSN